MRGFGHQHIALAQRLLFDHLAAGRAADLLVRNELEGDGQLRFQAEPAQKLQRMESHAHAALHVVDAGAIDAVALDRDGKVASDRIRAMDGIEMAEHQDAAFGAAVRSGEPRRDDVAEPVAAAARDGKAEARGFGGGKVHHPVDPGLVEGRAVDA